MRVIEALEKTILTPQAITLVVDKVVERVLKAHRTAPERSRALDADLRRLRRELDRFMALIASGNAPERILDEIRRREVDIEKLEGELARLRIAQPTKLDIGRIRNLALERAKKLRSALYEDVPQARKALQQLLVAPISFNLHGGEYRLEGETRVGALFAPEPALTRIRLATPPGFEPGFIP